MKKALLPVLAAILSTVVSRFCRNPELPHEVGNHTSMAQQAVCLDPAKPVDDRVDDLLRQLTLAEKISLLGTTGPAIERLKVPAMNGWNQSLHGVVWTEPTTMFPVPIIWRRRGIRRSCTLWRGRSQTKAGLSTTIDSPAHRQVALRAARESIVLLQNRDNFLPLNAAAIKTIAVIGPFADFAQTGPNYTGLYSTFVKPLDGIKKRVGPATKVLYARGSGIVESDNPEASYAEAVAIAKQADVCVLFVGINEILEREGIDRNFINLPPVQLQLVRRVFEANPRTVIVLQNGGPVSLVRGGGPPPCSRPDAPAILDMFWAGEEGGTAIADVLFGDYNPGGRLPYTVYQSVADPADEGVRHHQGLHLHVLRRRGRTGRLVMA